MIYLNADTEKLQILWAHKKIEIKQGFIYGHI
jgi:hypothetical protein